MTEEIIGTELTIAEAKNVVKFRIEHNLTSFLWSAPGIGKSDIVRQIALELGYGLVDFRANLRDPVDLRGMPAIDLQNRQTHWLPPSDLPHADKHGEKGILFLDELNTAPAQMQAACFGLVLDRHVGDYKLPDGWVCVAAGNRQGDRAAAQRTPSALDNRFGHITVKPDDKVFVDWLNENGHSPLLAAFIRFRPNLVHKFNPDQRAWPSPRSWSRAMVSLDAPIEIRMQSIAADIGFEAAAEVEGFLRTWHALPTIEEVLRNPATAKLPGESDVAARWAIVSSLASKATKDNFAALCAYAERLPREFMVLMVKDACKRNQSLMGSPAFLNWAVKNTDVTFK